MSDLGRDVKNYEIVNEQLSQSSALSLVILYFNLGRFLVNRVNRGILGVVTE